MASTKIRGNPNKTNTLKMALRKKQKEFLQYLEKSMGIVTTAAKAYGINPCTHYDWVKRSEEYREAAEMARSRADDLVESKLYELIKTGDTAATIFYCKTRLKHRGFTEKTDVDITTGGKPIDNTIQIEIIRHPEQVERDESTDNAGI